jgi:hypothetical protein
VKVHVYEEEVRQLVVDWLKRTRGVDLKPEQLRPTLGADWQSFDGYEFDWPEKDGGK